MDIKNLILDMVLEAYDSSSEEIKEYTTREYLEDLNGCYIDDFLNSFKNKSIENKYYIISIEDCKFDGNDGSDIYVVYKITNKQYKYQNYIHKMVSMTLGREILYGMMIFMRYKKYPK